MSEHTRREFIKSALAMGASGLAASMSDTILRAAAIEAEAGSTYLDAEHVVILMQENRSFDHAFGTLRGVRGFNDPRAIQLPDGNPVWVQTDDDGRSYGPFRLDINNTNATWMGSLPHSWTNQVDARNAGRHDRWLQSKRSGEEAYSAMPLTMGYYTREDVPFYYELADAFTICDQHFCSALTGTNPNRLYLWSGTIRDQQTADSPAMVINSDVGAGLPASWTTFPERLEEHGVSWKFYQNELAIDSGLDKEEKRWLSNFDDNPLEWFAQYHVNFAAGCRKYVSHLATSLPKEIAALRRQAETSGIGDQARIVRDLVAATTRLNWAEHQLRQWNDDSFAKLSAKDRNLHIKAFCTNAGDPHYRQLEDFSYHDGAEERRLRIPKGDVLHQFRRDVELGELPTVSWLAAPENFSDHPSSAWFGTWYVAEALNILIQNPEVWKRTIFLLTYDENDGYFDHAPPFVAPHPRRPETGRTSKSIDAAADYVQREFEEKRRPADDVRDSPIGLGYRVPLVIASPWSRGGCVCSQVFDHTSPLQFLEQLLSHKTRTPLRETNLTSWRRAVCGDLTAAFRPADADDNAPLATPSRDDVIESIHRSRHRQPPENFVQFGHNQLAELRRHPGESSLLPKQESGVRPSAPLPYELAVDGRFSENRQEFVIEMAVLTDSFGPKTAGSPFTAYATLNGDLQVRNYAVAPGERVEDSWKLGEFTEGRYRVAIHGPNGFFREFQGSADDPADVRGGRRAANGPSGRSGPSVVEFDMANNSAAPVELTISDMAYGQQPVVELLQPGGERRWIRDAQDSFGWYDLQFTVAGNAPFARRFAGRVETGRWGFSDPAMGGLAG